MRALDRVGSIPLKISEDRNMFFEGANRNKKSVTVDLKKEKGQKLIHALVKRSDVFMTNMRKPVLARMNMTYSSLKEYNPKMIYASVSAYGPRGPDRDQSLDAQAIRDRVMPGRDSSVRATSQAG